MNISKLQIALSKSKLRKNTTAYRYVRALTNAESIYDRIHLSTHKADLLCKLLNELGVSAVRGNDAPKGGKRGEYVQIMDTELIVDIISVRNKRAKEAEYAKIAEEKEISYEIEMVKTMIDDQWLEDKAHALSLTSKEKSDAFIGALCGLLERNALTIKHFYKVMRAL
jgi:hypothetical protein